jgi:ABC-type uncharacterized transport system permease subunit
MSSYNEQKVNQLRKSLIDALTNNSTQSENIPKLLKQIPKDSPVLQLYIQNIKSRKILLDQLIDGHCCIESIELKENNAKNKQANTFAYNLKNKNPGMPWRTVASKAVKSYFPELQGNSRAKKIDSIRNNLINKFRHGSSKRK